MQLSDEILIGEVARKDKHALEILYDRHASTILGILLKILGQRDAAEEMLQETFWQVWQRASTYSTQQGSFITWLYRIAREMAIGAHKRQNLYEELLTRKDRETTSKLNKK